MDSYNYIKKHVNEVSHILKDLIALVVKKRKSKKKADLVEIINQQLMESMKRRIEDIINIPIEDFISNLTADNKLNTYNLDLLAQLFFESARTLQDQLDKEQIKRLFNRSLHIYQYLLKAEVDFTYERHIQIKRLKEILLQ